MPEPTMEEALPGYELGEELGRGAMGEVIAGTHRKLDRKVAIKRLPKTFALDPAVVDRFGREAKLLASLTHPNIVPVYDYVEDRGLCLLVMESLPGGTVWDRFRHEGLSMPEACAIVEATCAGLQHAHDKRVLHRDVKPDNLLFDAGDTVKVADFGIATVLGGEETLATLDGEVLGTPAYMAPEQALGEPVGPGADVYAAGTMLYELLSGRLPFSEEGGAVALLQRRVDEAPVPLADVAPAVPSVLAAVVMRALDRDPARRYARADELAAAIAAAAEGSWGPAWRVEVVGAAASAGSNGSGATGTAARDAVEPASVGDGVEAAGSRATVQRGRAAPAAASRQTAIAGGGGPGPVMRSQREEPAPSLDLRGVDPREVVPVSALLRPPEVPTRQLAIASALALLMVVVAALGLGTGGSGSSGGGVPDEVTVSGTGLGGGSVIRADLEQPLEVRVPADLQGVATAQIELEVLGLAVGRSDLAPFVPDADGTLVAAPSVQTARLVTSGELAAELVLADVEGDPIARRDFAVRSDHVGVTLAAVLALVLAAVVAAYVASTTTPLRLGRRKRSAFEGMAVLGGLAGVDVVLWMWVVGISRPTWITVVVCGALGAVASVVAAQAVLVLGRRRRLDEALQNL